METKFLREAIAVEEAQRRVLREVRAAAVETVPLAESFGRRLAERVSATHPVPHFRRSVMDGYALRCAETRGATPDKPAVLQEGETIPCGSVARKPLAPGTAARIMTGAAVPDEADAVVMLELTERVQRDGVPCVSVKKELAAGENILPVAMELKQGEHLFGPGRRIGPGEAALLAMFGYAHVPVFRQPQVALFATGSELLRVEDAIVPGKIRNSNGYMLAAQIALAGGVPHMLGTVPDDLGLAQRLILEALDTYDAVITTGGVSVGDYDVIAELTAQWDGRLLFNKVAMRPGSPTTVGFRQGKPLFGLSGNPAACFVGCELFVKPYLLAVQGEAAPLPRAVTARMAAAYRKPDRYARYLRAFYRIEAGAVSVRPVGIDSSSETRSIGEANALLVVPYGEAALEPGDPVQMIPLDVCRPEETAVPSF